MTISVLASSSRWESQCALGCKSEEGVNNGGWGMHLTTRELARFGQLYLQHGIWEGCRILPGAWVNEATSKRAGSWGNAGAPDWTMGYGYQFWQGRHGSHRADGLLGQFCLLLPRLDALIVTTAGTLATQRILDLAWETSAAGARPGSGLHVRRCSSRVPVHARPARPARPVRRTWMA